MSTDNMKPTGRMRWVKWRTEGSTHWWGTMPGRNNITLQQEFADEKGNAEWRDIPTVFLPELTP